jgi:serine/threonine-protein kinase HipA
MSVNGKREHFTRDDFRVIAKSTLLKRGRADEIVERVVAAVRRWPEFASEANVADAHQVAIAANHRLGI